MNYSASNLDVVTESRIIGMILRIYSDASYILEPEAHSRAGGYSPLGKKSSNNTPIISMTPEKGSVHVECSITINGMVLAT